jgi:EAL and modified HD-GYP domain-containing signal transduction protein
MNVLVSSTDSNLPRGAAPIQTVVITRQPILDVSQQLLGYDLLVHSADWHSGAESVERNLVHAFVDLGVERLVGAAEAFMRLPRLSLAVATALPVSGHRAVISIDASVPIDEQTLIDLTTLRRNGFRIALENPPHPESDDNLQRAVALAQFAKFAMARAPDAAIVGALRARGLKVIASGIDTQAELRSAAALGCDGFQGYFLCQPEAVVGTRLRENKLSVLRLLAAIEDPNKGPVELDAIIRTDAALSYKVLRCVNSAYFALPVRVRSILHATVYLGVNRIRNWIRMLAISGLDDCPTELLKFALIRGRMCELLASDLPNDQREMAFTVGLFSLLDAMLSAPLEELLSHIPLTDEIRVALLERTGQLARLLEPVYACERGDWNLLESSRVSTAVCAAAYVDAVAWADHVFEAGGNAEPA